MSKDKTKNCMWHVTYDMWQIADGSFDGEPSEQYLDVYRSRYALALRLSCETECVVPHKNRTSLVNSVLSYTALQLQPWWILAKFHKSLTRCMVWSIIQCMKSLVFHITQSRWGRGTMGSRNINRLAFLILKVLEENQVIDGKAKRDIHHYAESILHMTRPKKNGENWGDWYGTK